MTPVKGLFDLLKSCSPWVESHCCRDFILLPILLLLEISISFMLAINIQEILKQRAGIPILDYRVVRGPFLATCWASHTLVILTNSKPIALLPSCHHVAYDTCMHKFNIATQAFWMQDGQSATSDIILLQEAMASYVLSPHQTSCVREVETPWLPGKPLVISWEQKQQLSLSPLLAKRLTRMLMLPFPSLGCPWWSKNTRVPQLANIHTFF